MEALAREIAGFNCERCGECCQAAYGDNTVAVFPFEVEKIQELTRLEWLEIVSPGPVQYVDTFGTPHCFEWTLKRDSNGDCRFFKNGRCTIYPQRPLLCRTYPFHLTWEGAVEVSECQGARNRGKVKRARETPLGLAWDLKERLIVETRETISFIENFSFRDYSRIGLVVHDSRGAFHVTGSGVEAL